MYKAFVILLLASLGYAKRFDFSATEDQVKNNITFEYFPGRDLESRKTIPYKYGLDILNEPSFDGSQLTVFFFHGFTETPSILSPNYSFSIIAPELLRNTNANVVIVNYEYFVRLFDWNIILAVSSYSYAVENVDLIALAMADFFQLFLNNCNCLRNIHLIGFSLGCQIISFTAQRLVGDFKFPRITGLDPAGPLFYVNHLSKNDADFVDVIHTDAWWYGTERSCGHSDFWPDNGVRIQSGCPETTNPIDPCSHYKSCHIYAETVLNHTKYKVIERKTMFNSNPNLTTYMGFGAVKQGYQNDSFNFVLDN